VELIGHSLHKTKKTKKNKMTNYKWEITSLPIVPLEDGLNDVVVTVNWTRTAEQYVGGEPISVSCFGTMPCDTPSSTDFTAYPDLTYEQVCGWLDAGLDVAQIDATLNLQLNSLINPPIVNLPLPFNNPTI
jgi:hypothetical protein